jgi:hypothetical protein
LISSFQIETFFGSHTGEIGTKEYFYDHENITSDHENGTSDQEKKLFEKQIKIVDHILFF